VPYVTRQYCAFVLAGDISTHQHCAPTTMLAGDSYMCQQSIFHVSAQIVFGLVDGVQILMCNARFEDGSAVNFFL
jgi:hypothetical protein